MRNGIKSRKSSEVEKPHMIIVDDQPQMMGRFVRNFEALGFRVTPIIVSRGDLDECFHDGHIDHTRLQTEINAMKGHDEVWEKLQQREALAHFKYGVKSKSELRALLSDEALKPDVVLSDERMRLNRKNVASDKEMRANDDVICGEDVMGIAKEIFPKVPRAIHTMIYDAQLKPVPKGEKIKAEKQGHMVFAKDDYEDTEQPQAAAIATWFKEKLRTLTQSIPIPSS